MNIGDITQTVTEKVTSWVQAGIELLPNFVVAVIVLIVFWALAKIGKRISQTAFDRATRNRQVSAIGSRMVYIAIIASGLMVALSVLQLEKTVTSLLAGAGIIGLALGFAFQDLATNLMSGFLIATSEPLQNGDVIETGGFFGTVQSVSLRFSMLRTFDGQLVRIPNKQIFETPLVNYTSPGERRIDIPVGISYGDDLEKARDVAIEAAKGVPQRDKDKDVKVQYAEFGDSSINFHLRFWIKFPDEDYFQARSEAIMRVKKAFDENGITIPFPIRTLDFGIVGGEKLSDMLPLKAMGGE